MIDARTGAMDPPGGPRDGGFAARRAIVRWAWRLFRREWRQQALVLGLLTVAVVASILSATIAYNVAPAGGRADFGTASHFLWFDGGDSGQLRADLAQAEDWFGVTQSITYRNVTVPGAFDALEVRGQDPDGPYGGPMLALREGRYPEGVTEIAVTRRVVETLGLEIGRSLVIDGVERAVVGLVENPNDLRQQFALVDPNQEVRPDSVQILVQSEDNHVFGFRSPSMSARTSRGMTAQLGILAALGSLGTAAIGMVFVALIATASFVVLAQRRLRQLGMLAAVGATERNLGLVTLANGIFAGIVAALIGSALALAAWIASVPILEEPFGHRIDRFGVPWWLLISVNVLALFTAASAAWWPARAAARIPIVLALSGRPPRPSGTERSAVIAVALMVAGVAGLLIAPATTNPLLVTAATVASIIGILFLCPSSSTPPPFRWAACRWQRVSRCVTWCATSRALEPRLRPLPSPC
jgi:putative ABC transport system permease protein